MSDSPLEFGVELMRERSFLKGFCTRQPLTAANTEQIVCATLRKAWLNRDQIAPTFNLRIALAEIATAEMSGLVRHPPGRSTADLSGAAR